jgi:hypothetical protein
MDHDGRPATRAAVSAGKRLAAATVCGRARRRDAVWAAAKSMFAVQGQCVLGAVSAIFKRVVSRTFEKPGSK